MANPTRRAMGSVGGAGAAAGCWRWLIDFGRPRVVQLAVLIDRGHRELPIQADVVGRTVATSSEEVIEVRFQATDGQDGVELMERVEES